MAARWNAPASAQPIRQKCHEAARLAGLLHVGVVWVLLRCKRMAVRGGQGKESGAMNFSVCGRIRVVRCWKWSIRMRFTGKP